MGRSGHEASPPFEAGDYTAWDYGLRHRPAPCMALDGAAASRVLLSSTVGTRIHPSEGLGYPKRKTQRDR